MQRLCKKYHMKSNINLIKVSTCTHKWISKKVIKQENCNTTPLLRSRLPGLTLFYSRGCSQLGKWSSSLVPQYVQGLKWVINGDMKHMMLRGGMGTGSGVEARLRVCGGGLRWHVGCLKIWARNRRGDVTLRKWNRSSKVATRGRRNWNGSSGGVLSLNGLSTILLNQDGLNETNEVRGSHRCEKFCTGVLKTVNEGFEVVNSWTKIKIMMKLSLENVVVTQEMINMSYDVWQANNWSESHRGVGSQEGSKWFRSVGARHD